MAKSKVVRYKEPDNFIPKELRKKYGLGEYAKTKKTTKKTAKKK